MKPHLAFIVATACALFVTARAENPFAFTSTPGKLPKNVVPRHYAVTLRPDVAALTTEGEVTIELDVLAPTRTLVFNANGLTLPTATVDGATVPAPVIDATEQTAKISLPAELPAGKHTLRLEFRGVIGRAPVGIYAEKYRVGTKEKQMLGTEMEPTDARRVFPCWDEPVFRATFQLTVAVPTGQVAVSNTPVIAERPARAGFRDVVFAPTPSMASYLVVLCVGELEQITDEVDGVKLGIWTTAGKKEQARYALEATKRIVHFYNGYFGVKYPLPKLDQIAIPGGFAGAMENWGAITYNERYLLFDPNTSSQATKEAIFGTVAHEIAHQWFGNLVTMAWWDNLWLNEGFASWMGTKCTDALNPDWQVWLRASDDKEKVMGLDARRGTHPIQQVVQNESGATDAFDDITYKKGQGVLRMLESYLGENDFRAGIQDYVRAHAYGSTTTANLWAALEKASGKPVGALAEGWTLQPGFPVVNVAAREADGRLEVQLTQERFTLNDPKAAPVEWKIPVSISALDHPGAVKVSLLDKKSDVVAIPGRVSAGVKVNMGNRGFYRAAYSAPLARAQAAVFATLPDEDRVNLLSDAWAMVEAGRGDVGGYLDLVAALGANESSLAVWELVLDNLGFIHRLERGTPGEKPFEQWMIARVRIPFQKLGWDAAPGERSNDGVLRARLLTVLGAIGDPAVVAEARRRFARFRTTPSSLAADLRTPVTAIVGRHADAETWEQLHQLAQATESTEERGRYQNAFQHVAAPALAQRALDLALTEERPFAQWFGLVPSVAEAHPELAWTFAQSHADALLAKIPESGAFATRNNYFSRIAEPFSDAARADEVEAYVAKKIGPNGAAETAKTAERIRFKAEFKRRVLPKVDAWIRRRS